MMMMTAVNFYSHINETGAPEERAKAIAARKANRGVPYMFLKAPSSVIGTGETILIPHGRTELDWEIELATVIGRRARYVAAPKAQDHVFGYTVMLDISDRGGRPPGGFSAGVDWFVMKGQDTFGPMGPFIVPKEFFGNPMTDLKQTLLVGTDQRQQSDSSDMIHSVWEVIEYASSLVTLQPGDVIGAGTSGGVGMGRRFAVRRCGWSQVTRSPQRSTASARCATRSKRRRLLPPAPDRICRRCRAIGARAGAAEVAAGRSRVEAPAAGRETSFTLCAAGFSAGPRGTVRRRPGRANRFAVAKSKRAVIGIPANQSDLRTTPASLYSTTSCAIDHGCSPQMYV
jgi:2-keto-4-pentenoate hydratase/2-oxohepta-3-ene-1,7-dioic acid hydratase in catechol pathway